MVLFAKILQLTILPNPFLIVEMVRVIPEHWEKLALLALVIVEPAQAQLAETKLVMEQKPVLLAQLIVEFVKFPQQPPPHPQLLLPTFLLESLEPRN